MPVPDKWNNYKPLDKLIEHTPFLCFKTPLRTSTLQSVVKEDWFRIDELLSMSRKHGKLHTVIALSGTTKYYDFEELEKKNIKFRWIPCHGHNAPVQLSEYSKFVEALDTFRQETKENKDALLGIHCTHGVNRTGFMVCKYLVIESGWTPASAIAAFERARGYPIERQAYIDALNTLVPVLRVPFVGAGDGDAHTDTPASPSEIIRGIQSASKRMNKANDELPPSLHMNKPSNELTPLQKMIERQFENLEISQQSSSKPTTVADVVIKDELEKFVNNVHTTVETGSAEEVSQMRAACDLLECALKFEKR